jgi:hypothetical protein
MPATSFRLPALRGFTPFVALGDVNVPAFFLQAFVSSRLGKYKGLRGVLLALPLVALGGYSIIPAGAGLSLVRWIKTVENATDYARHAPTWPTQSRECAWPANPG